MEEQLRRLEQHPGVGGVMVWTHRGGFLGKILNDRMKEVDESVPWDPQPTVQQVFDALEKFVTTSYKPTEADVMR